ncbi:hybrid sensor histidine kinase/response regulator [Chryseobacterium sp. A301]
MKLKPQHNTFYNIVAIVVLVLALSAISIISFVTNRNSEKLAVVVTNLSKNKIEIDRIDKAIQLLYKAENNSRLYVVTRDPKLYTAYVEQLNGVSAIIDSIHKNEDKGIDGLVQDKKRKTELYIKARLLADSLLKDRKIAVQPKVLPPVQKAPIVIVERVESAPESKTVVEEYAVEKKKSKGLFGRIKDAIANKPREKELKSVTTTSSVPKDSKATIREEKELPTAAVAPTLQSASSNYPNLARLTNQEKSLLMANNELFDGLKNLLETLKQEQITIQAKRQLELGSNAATLMQDLKSNNQYNLILSLLLTGIILTILLLLYNNMKRLQVAKYEAELYAQQKSDFVTTVSHEMRTPLHSIHAFTDELSNRNVKNGEDSEIIDAIKLSSNMLISVVNNILDFTKMEQGKFKLNQVPFVPSQIMKEVILGLAIQAKRKNLTITSTVDESTDLKIYGDAFQFRQVLVNTINNAIKYTEKGTITVFANFKKIDAISGILELSIADTGIGIAEDQLPYIFDAYTTQNVNSEIKEGRTGLGLSIIKRIVDYHKGDIKVTSKLGEGSCFAFELPYDIYLDEESIASTYRSGTLSKILLVENDPLNLKILNLLLVNDSYEVTNSLDGAEALELYLSKDFDLLITDISLPGLTGYELANRIRQLPESKKALVPIIAISGFEKPQDGSDSDFSCWLTKPYDTEELLSIVKECQKDMGKA